MENIDVLNLFQGIGTMVASGWFLAIARVVLVMIGFLLIYLGWKGILEPMIMIPMGLGMIAINFFGLMCGTWDISDRTDCVGHGINVERECLRCHGRWS